MEWSIQKSRAYCRTAFLLKVYGDNVYLENEAELLCCSLELHSWKEAFWWVQEGWVGLIPLPNRDLGKAESRSPWKRRFPDTDIPHTETCIFTETYHIKIKGCIYHFGLLRMKTACSHSSSVGFLWLWLQFCRHTSRLINLIIFLQFLNAFGTDWLSYRV